AVVGFGEVDQLEVEAEGAREPVGGGEIEGVDAGQGLLEVFGGGGGIAAGIRFAARDGRAAKRLDGVVESVTGLFAEHAAKQRAERADVAAQRSFLEIAGRRLKFRKALRPVGGCPQ